MAGFGSVGGVFDFGFTAAGAEVEDGEGGETWGSALDEIDFTEVERKLDGALAGFVPLDVVEEVESGSDDTVQGSEWKRDHWQQQRSSSVWEDGEKFWKLSQGRRDVGRPEVAIEPSSPLGSNDMTPKKDVGWEHDLLGARRSIQMTPKSLYDSDGFLRT
jgi:hypothetical protein